MNTPPVRLRLSDGDVRRIREDFLTDPRESWSGVGRRFGVTGQTIRRVVTGELRRRAPGPIQLHEEVLTRRLTAFAAFADLLNAAGGYRPSIYTSGRNAAENSEHGALARIYDAVQERRGDPRRAFRG